MAQDKSLLEAINRVNTPSLSEAKTNEFIVVEWPTDRNQKVNVSVFPAMDPADVEGKIVFGSASLKQCIEYMVSKYVTEKKISSTIGVLSYTEER